MSEEVKPTNLSAMDFFKFDIRSGTILKVEAVEKSKKLLKLEVSFGPIIGNRVIMAGIAQATAYGSVVDGVWQDKAMIGQKVIAILNLESRLMMGVDSHGMLLAGKDNDGMLWLPNSFGLPDGAEIG